jgi:hypothetical protein
MGEVMIQKRPMKKITPRKMNKVQLSEMQKMATENPAKLPHEDFQKEVMESCITVLDKVVVAFKIAQESVNQDGSISLQSAASVANILGCFIQIADTVDKSNMRAMYTSLEEILIKNGAVKGQTKVENAQ